MFEKCQIVSKVHLSSQNQVEFTTKQQDVALVGGNQQLKGRAASTGASLVPFLENPEISET